MSIAAFDTHAAVTALREAGFDERQAEGVVATVRDAVAEGVATRADVARLESKMATGAGLAEVKADVARLETRVTVRLYGGLFAAVGAVVALIKLLP